MDWKLVLVLCVCLLCCALASWFVYSSVIKAKTKTDEDQADNPNVMTAPVVLTPAPPMTTTEPPPVTTMPPARNTDVMIYAPGNPWVVYPPGYWGPRYAVPAPRFPAVWWPEQPRPVQPGGSWPELMGRDKDDAIAYVMSTYPNMTVAAVRYGAPLPQDYRTDRFVVVYDVYTRKVVGASIG